MPGAPTQQAEYVVWRDSVVEHGGDRKSKSRNGDLDPLPEDDPGKRIAHRWRKRLCSNGAIDEEKLTAAIADALDRTTRNCEQDAAEAGALRLGPKPQRRISTLWPRRITAETDFSAKTSRSTR